MKNLKLILLLFPLIFIFGCSDKESLLDEMPDTSISENLEAEKRQTAIDFVPAPCLVASDIQIFIPPECGPNWTAGIQAAIMAYNNTNTGINMVEVSTLGEATIDVSCQDFAEGPDPDNPDFDLSDVFGIGEVPAVDGMIGEQIFLNTDLETTCGNPCFFASVAMHELAHTLGFFHNENTNTQCGIVGDIVHDGDGTFTFPNTTTKLVWIPGTAPQGTNDPTSVLNAGTNCFTPNCGFNANDILALTTLYPRPDNPCECPNAFDPCTCEESINIRINSIWEQEGCVPANANITVCAYGWAGQPVPDVTFNWTFNGSFFPYVYNGNFDRRCVRVNVGSSGGQISVFATNDECGTNSRFTTIRICDDDGPTSPGGIIER